MKFASETGDPKFCLPPWRAHWSFLSARTTRPFLLLSCLIHALILWLVWQWVGITFAPGTLSSKNAGQHFDILLTGTPDKPSQQKTTVRVDKRHSDTEKPAKTSPDHKVKKQPSDTRKPSGTKSLNTDKQPPLQGDPQQADTDSQRESSGLRQHSELAPIKPDLVQHKKQTSSTGPVSVTQKEQSNAITKAASETKPSAIPSSDTVINLKTGMAPQSRLHMMITTQVKQALRRHLHYPYIARRRGWDGKVLLGFQVNRQGRLINIHLSNSSGYAILDNSALSAMQQIKQITRIPPLLPETTDTLSIPVIFELTQG